MIYVYGLAMGLFVGGVVGFVAGAICGWGLHIASMKEDKAGERK